MEKLGLNEIREKFLEFFESKGHLRMKSASLVPQSDKSLLLINSGMAPLKPFFTGQDIPPSLRVTTCQKCIRTPDIERVGKTARHGTFFEMLGNFSFGDYFKEEAIAWGWELCTEVFKMPAERLWITIYLDDDEAFDIWHNKIGLPEERIVRMGKEDNFWEIGLGPCGPCSEIYYDRGPGTGCGKEDCKLGCDCDRYLEFWNLVFTQFDKDEDGNYNKLANPNIDTGMGLERISAIMQEVDNIFEIDTVKYILDGICSLAGTEYGKDRKKDVSIRVITDHIRSVTFMISDGILPSNEGRGYVLRRLLRRAARHGRLLGLSDPFLSSLALKVIDVSGDAYTELREKKDYILNIIDIEENRFYDTLDQGLTILQGFIEELKLTKSDTLSGENVFRLYDTYGFPLDLTKDILEEQGLSVDEETFQKEMQSQRERARAARGDSDRESWKEDIYAKLDWDIKTEFAGYDSFSKEAAVKAIVKENTEADSAKEGEELSVILDVTPFYAESGGQSADTGKITGKNFELDVKDCKKVTGERFAHICKVSSGQVKKGDRCIAKIDVKRRMAIARNHTATHLLHKALRMHLGTHVEQAGSLVTHERLRFDFSHFKAMTKEEIDLIEKEVNRAIIESLDVNASETSLDEARKMGAIALFGEKYGDTVRVITMGDYSTELCGGSHLKNTSQAGLFKIVSEGGIAAGVRRIEAVTGEKAYEYVKEEEKLLGELCERLKAHPSECLKKADALILQLKEAEKEISLIKSRMAEDMLDELIVKANEEKGVKYIVTSLDNMSIDSLREMGDKLRDKLGTSFIMLSSFDGEKTVLLAMASKCAVAKGVHSGNIIKEAAKLSGGSGGGRPEMAQGGIKDRDKLNLALDAVPGILKKMIK